jgi:hypothetical protein
MPPFTTSTSVGPSVVWEAMAAEAAGLFEVDPPPAEDCPDPPPSDDATVDPPAGVAMVEVAPLPLAPVAADEDVADGAAAAADPAPLDTNT